MFGQLRRSFKNNKTKPVDTYRYTRSSVVADHVSIVKKTEAFLENRIVRSSDDGFAHVSQNENDILDCLRRNGFAILPEFFSDELASLRKEFTSAFADPREPYEEFARKTNMKQIKDFKSKSDIPVGLHPFYSDMMYSTAELFFGEPFYFNDPIILHHAQPTDGNPILPCHFDDRQNIKFFVYLDDVDIENGALSFIPKTNRVVTQYLHKCDEIGLRARSRPNTASFQTRGRKSFVRFHLARDSDITFPVEAELDFNPHLLHVCEPAGTMIVFDSNTIHRGGIVSSGCERRIIRAHSQAKSERARH